MTLYNINIYYTIMPTSKRNRCSQSKTNRRCKTIRRHKRAKGGMFRRSATEATKKVLKKVFGEGPDRVEKIYQMGKAAVDGATKEAAKKGAEIARSSRRSFEELVPTSSPFHIRDVEKQMTPPMSSRGHDENQNPNYNTPKKSTPTDEPKLALRTRPSETPKTRVRRLSSVVVPTAQNPVPLVQKLDFEAI
jgi:hypothetical protein